MGDFERERLEELKTRARHEIGHYLVGRILGFKAVSVMAGTPLLIGSGGAAEFELIKPINSIDEFVDYCERRVKVLFAEVLAESLVDGAVDLDQAMLYLTTSGQNDYAKAREHLHLLRNVLLAARPALDADSEIQQISKRLWQEASRLVTAEQELIEELVEVLAARGVTSLTATLTDVELSAHPSVARRFQDPEAS